MKHRALVTKVQDKKTITSLEERDVDSLQKNEILIKAEYSSLNYKDALGVTGTGKIFKIHPIIGGIDVAGTVAKSLAPDFKEGDAVLVNGCGLGELQNGGFAEYCKVPAEWAVRMPKGLTAREAMIYGTAGFTASICLYRFEQNNQRPELGPIVVTGASGGVGGFAVSFLSKAGFDVIAVTGKKEIHSYLKELGATEIASLEDLDLGTRPLESARFGGAIDNLGGETLAGLMRHTQLWGNIACVGLAQNFEFKATVMPMILRGVSLLGISSGNCPRDLRLKLWQDLDGKLKPADLEQFISKEIKLEEVLAEAQQMIQRKTTKRILVRCQI